MKKLLIIMSLLTSTAVFAKAGDACHPGDDVLKKAALTLANLNLPEGEISVKVLAGQVGPRFMVIVDDNYGTYGTVIVTEKSSNGFCRIKSIIEL